MNCKQSWLHAPFFARSLFAVNIYSFFVFARFLKYLFGSGIKMQLAGLSPQEEMILFKKQFCHLQLDFPPAPEPSSQDPRERLETNN